MPKSHNLSTLGVRPTDGTRLMEWALREVGPDLLTRTVGRDEDLVLSKTRTCSTTRGSKGASVLPHCTMIGSVMISTNPRRAT